MRPRSITFRLTLFFSAASLIVLLAIGYLIGSVVERHFEEQDLAELHGKLGLIRHSLAKVGTAVELEAVGQRLDDALVGHHDLQVRVSAADGRTLYQTPGAAFPTEVLAQRPQAQPMLWSVDGREYRGIVASGGTAIPGLPPATVLLAVNIEHHREFMAALRGSLWPAIASGILLTALFGWVAARRGLEPVREVTRLAQGISASRLHDRLAPDSVPTELDGLATAFNDMLARLEDSFLRLSDFSSDLAHELRTPISNLMTETEVVLSRERSADAYREVLYSNLEEHGRLARTIGDMLFLAKADHGLIVPNRTAVDLATETRQLFEFYEALADAQGVHLERVGEARVPGDPLMLRRALSNLLSNAIRHTPRGGAVRVLIEDAPPGEVCLSVENQGEDILAEHLPRLFDRFYRVDAARQYTSEGAGLGLAITRSIVEAHQGRIRAFSAHGVTRFEITLPGPGSGADECHSVAGSGI